MGTFNAGAIEANLTLGRSDWTRDLKKTKKEIEDLERSSITIGIDADDDNFRVVVDNVERYIEDLDRQSATIEIDADDDSAKTALDRIDAELDRLEIRRVTFSVDADTDNAAVQLDNIEALATALDADPVHIHVEVDAAEAEEKLIQLLLMVQRLELATANIDVDVRGYSGAIARLATLDAAVSAVDDRTVHIDVDVDRNALERLVGSGAAAGADSGGGSLGLLKILIYAIILLSPVLAVAISSATAAVIGFAAAVAGAAGAAAILAGGLFLLVKKFKDTDPSDYTPGMQAFADSLDHIKDSVDKVMDAMGDEGFNLMADAIDLVAGVLPRLVPLFDRVAGAMGGVLGEVQNFVDSPEFDEMLDFFGGFGVDMLVSFLHIGGNLIRFFGRLFQAIEPFAREMMSGLEDVTAGWAEWADDLEHNDSFQKFMENASHYGPMVLDMLGSLIQAFMAIGEAIEPFAGPMLTILTEFFDLIANAPTEVLSAIVVAIVSLIAGFVVIAPLIEGAVAAFEGLLAVIGFIASPIGLIVLAIVALVAILIYMWETNEEFRNIIKDIWQDIVDTVVPIIEDIVGAIKKNWGPISKWAQDTFGDVQDIIVLVFDIIRIHIKTVLAIIRFIWKHWGEDIIALVGNAFRTIGGIISGAFKIIKGIFMIFKGILTGDWRLIWEGIKTVLKGALQVIWSAIKGAFNTVRIIFNALKDVVKSVWSATWNWAEDRIGDFVGWVKGKWNDLIGWLSGLGGRVSSAVSGIWDGIGDSFRSVINQIIGWWNNLSFSVDIPNKIPGLPDSFTISTPNVNYLAEGAFVTDPMLAMIGEGKDNEVVAPEPVLERIVRDNSGANIDYGKMARAMAAVLAPILRALGTGVTAEQLQDLIEAASVNLNIDARSEGDSASKLAKALGFELRVLGYGGKAYV